MYGFLPIVKSAPESATVRIRTLPDSWYTTSMLMGAKNHCAAVMTANLALCMGRIKSGALLQHIYADIGNGPVLRAPTYAARCLETLGISVEVHRYCRAVTSQIDMDRPVALLLTAGLTHWHWVLVTGYVKGFVPVLEVADGWHEKTHLYTPGEVSRQVYAASFQKL